MGRLVDGACRCGTHGGRGRSQEEFAVSFFVSNTNTASSLCVSYLTTAYKPTDVPNNTRSDFLGKEDYAIGDFSKEIDSRVKQEVAKMREKDDYELGDLSVVLDDKVKELVCELSGKDEVSVICMGIL